MAGHWRQPQSTRHQRHAFDQNAPHRPGGVAINYSVLELTPTAPQAEVKVSTAAHYPHAAYGLRETTAACLVLVLWDGNVSCKYVMSQLTLGSH